MSISVFRPALHRRDLNGVLDCLVSDRIGPGPLSAELAATLARQLGLAGGLCTATYETAVALALDALGLQPGDAVLLSALAPGVYRRVCARRGLRTLAVDVSDGTPLPDPALAERLLASARASGQKVGALVLHYTLGYVPEGEELLGLGVPVLEDVSQALGGVWNGTPCGARGPLTVLSLQPEAMITAGGGAAVLARERRTARLLSAAPGSPEDDSLLPDMNAALGLTQLRQLERFVRLRREMAAVFQHALSRSPHAALVPVDDDQGVPYGFAVRVETGLGEVRQYASKRGVDTRRPFSDCQVALGDASEERKAEAVAAAGPVGRPSGPPPPAAEAAEGFPHARDLLLRALQFPLYPAMPRKDVQLVARVLATLP